MTDFKWAPHLIRLLGSGFVGFLAILLLALVRQLQGTEIFIYFLIAWSLYSSASFLLDAIYLRELVSSGPSTKHRIHPFGLIAYSGLFVSGVVILNSGWTSRPISLVMLILLGVPALVVIKMELGRLVTSGRPLLAVTISVAETLLRISLVTGSVLLEPNLAPISSLPAASVAVASILLFRRGTLSWPPFAPLKSQLNRTLLWNLLVTQALLGTQTFGMAAAISPWLGSLPSPSVESLMNHISFQRAPVVFLALALTPLVVQGFANGVVSSRQKLFFATFPVMLSASFMAGVVESLLIDGLVRPATFLSTLATALFVMQILMGSTMVGLGRVRLNLTWWLVTVVCFHSVFGLLLNSVELKECFLWAEIVAGIIGLTGLLIVRPTRRY